MSSLLPRLLRSAFAVSEYIAPEAAGRIAFRLFSRTADPRRPGPRERLVLEAAAPAMARARQHRLCVAFGTVAAHLFAPGGTFPAAGTVLVLHGWHSRTEHMLTLVDACLEQGFRVLALDLPGHGASSGRRLDMARAVEAVAMADLWFGPFVAIVGHSFGGAVALNALAGSVKGFEALTTRRLVLIGAPSSMPAVFDDFGRFLGLGPRTQTALAGRVLEIAGRPLSDFVGAEQLAALDVETLVLHAPDDREVPFADALAFEAAGSHVRLERAPGLGHRRILADEHVARVAATFVATPSHERTEPDVARAA